MCQVFAEMVVKWNFKESINFLTLRGWHEFIMAANHMVR